MTYRILLLLIPISFFGCKLEPQDKNIEPETIEIEPSLIPEDTFNYDTLKGIYSGDFGGNDIRIILNYVSQTNAIGYNIHKGLQRNISGKVFKSNDSIYMFLSEPGDHEFDGTFNLTFVGIDKSPSGLWASNSGKLKPKKIQLSKIGNSKNTSDKINASNFANYFGYLYNDIGNFTFEKDGLCIFEYYPKEDDINRIEQLQEVKGTWSLKNNVVTIDWEENDVFLSRRAEYTLSEDEYQEGMLIGETDTLNAYFF